MSASEKYQIVKGNCWGEKDCMNPLTNEYPVENEITFAIHQIEKDPTRKWQLKKEIASGMVSVWTDYKPADQNYKSLKLDSYGGVKL